METEQQPSRIRLATPTVTGTQLDCLVEATGYVDRFFAEEEFRLTYDFPLSEIPPGILTIPVLSQVLPVACASGADIYLQTLDDSFANAVTEIIESYNSMYPTFMHPISLHIENRYEHSSDNRQSSFSEPDQKSNSALLFTGGVDSMCSYIRHQDEGPRLISVRGWTISSDPIDDEKWTGHTNRISAFADERGLDVSFIESNMLQALDHPMLLASFSRYVDGGWYSSVGHGIGLLGTCAPLCYHAGIENLYIAATHWDGIDLAWGSRPELDETIEWSGTECFHDAYSLTRQERIDVIADHITNGHPSLQLQTCNTQLQTNCGECEKCYRTAVGLRLSNLDPSKHGYPFNSDNYQEIKQALTDGTWILGEDERYMWEDIRDRIPEVNPQTKEEAEFFNWLEAADLNEIVANSNPPRTHQLLRIIARTLPPNNIRNTVSDMGSNETVTFAHASVKLVTCDTLLSGLSMT